MEFTLGIITSIIAGIFLIIGTYYYKQLKKKFDSLQESSCEDVFSNQAEAEVEILDNLNKSNWSNIFICRGYSLIEPDRNYYSGIKNAKKCRILISKPYLQNGNFNPEVEKRVNELPSGKKIKPYTANIEEVISELTTTRNVNKNLDFREHEEPVVFRMYMFPEYLYLSFFEENTGASKSKIYKYKNTSSFYIAFKKYFELVWEKSI